MSVLRESFNMFGTPDERGDLATLRWRLLLLNIPLRLLHRPLLPPSLDAFRIIRSIHHNTEQQQ